MKLPPAVRRVADPLLQGIRVPILSGINRGRWWSLISSGSGYGSGRRAADQMALLGALIRPGDCVWDVGAHQGYVSLTAAHRVGATGNVHAFEPSRSNREILKRHVHWNRLENVAVHPFALSDFDGETSFGGDGSSKTYTLGGGSETVPVRTGQSLIDSGICPAPTFAKIDVEGAEGELIAGLLPALPRRARLFVAIHSREADETCSALLAAAGWELVPSRALAACRAGRWESDPDLFCMGPDWDQGPADRGLLEAARF